MDKNQERNLEAISRIDDEIIDRNTRKRVSLANRKGKKLPPRKWYIIGGSLVAAIAVVLTTVLILVNVLAKQVPIYTGMTVSNQLPTVQASSGSVTVLDLSTPGKGSWSGDYDRDHGDLSDPFEKPLKDSLTVVGAGEERYYAKPGEDIYITVHIDNPDKFEILSFTLNGEKYTSYMFEAGSDLENLILKVNVGAAEGVVAYTIDAIKYVDGTEIKDVRMEGDQTVEVGVYTEKQPTANIKSETVGFNSLSFTVAAEDLMDLVGDSEGRLQAVLYDGERIIGVKDINTKGDTAVTFENLQTNTLYQYAVIAVYDALDGTGMNTYILWQKGFYTKAPVLFDDVSTDKVGVSFGFKWDDTVTDKSLTSLTLYRGDAKVRDVALFATALDGLTPDTAYTLIATYHHGGKAESIRLDFTTDPLIYTVKYLLEDLDGNGYTVDQTVESVVAPGAVFAPDVIAYSGFTAPAAQQKTASTEDAAPVIEYRYTRNSYTVILSDSGSDTLRSLKYGAPLPTPEKEGYTFIGWFSDDVQITAVPATSMTVYARWAGEATAADLLYSGVGRITIEGLKNKALTDVVIPAYINDAPVVSIGAEAFADNDWLHSVTLPATVTTIGAAAFEGCTALDTVTLSTGLTSVGTNAFGNCTALSAVIVDGTLGDWAKINFTDASANPLKLCGNLTVGGVNVLSDTLTVTGAGRIGTYAFAGCTGLTSVTVPDTVTEIGEGAFFGCDALTNMTIPFVGSSASTTAEDLYQYPFAYIFGTTRFEGATMILPEYIANGDTVDTIPYYVPSTLRSVIVTGGRILTGAFSYCSMLTEVVLPDGLTEISNMAFAECTNLTTVNIPATVTKIGSQAFYRVAIESLTLPGSLATVGRCAFQRCERLSTVTLSAGITSIGEQAFDDCSGLEEIVLPSGLLTIGRGAFRGCTGLTSLTVPDTVTEIGEGAFSGCSGLQSMTVPFVGAVLDAEERSPEWHPFGYIFGTEYYDGCVRTDAIYYITESMSSYYVPSSLRSVTVTGGKITEVSFYDCSMLTSVTLSAGVTAIGDEAFKDCSGLKEIVLPSGLLTIGNSAFSGCTGLTEIVLPSGMLTIGGGAFNGCTGVSELVIPASVTSLGDGLFGDNLVSVTLPATTDLAGAISWGNTSIKTIVINGGTCIPADAFRNCRGVEKIVIPASVTGIGQGAFYGCDALKTLVIPCALQKAHFGSMVITSNGEELSYDYPDALQTVIIAEGTTALDAFEWEEELNTVTTVVLPVTLTSINENAFASYTNLTAICYGGTQTRWETSFGTVSLPTGAKVYDYSATETATAGMWYYDASGNVVTVPHTTA